MKKGLGFAVVVLLFSSCKDTWPQEYKDQYHADCMETAKDWAGSEVNAKIYCDCVLEKTVEKYPNVEDLLEHAMEVYSDPDIQRCKETITPSK